jgi:hypothetical protein
MSTFTPGPWVVFDPKSSTETFGIDGPNGEPVVWYGKEYCGGIPNIADATLMADAPAMLDALLHLLALAEQLEESLDGHFDCRAIDEIEADGDLPEQIVKARALIAKHRGGK